MCSKLSCLGEPWCSEWGCCETDSDREDFKEPPKKKAKGKGGKESKRFVAPTSSVEMEKICKGFVPKNTQKATNWAVRVFEEWRVERNKATSDDGKKCPSNLLECPLQTLLNYWLSRFVVEVRREDGQQYPPTTISNLLAGLYRECRKYDRNCPNFMNRKDPMFKELSGALQVRYRELREAGVGAVVKHAAVVSSEEEDALWVSKVIGDHAPLALQRAVFFYVGKTFCLRGGEEQRRLKPSQFIRSSNPDCYTYVENGSKNKSGLNLKEKNKVVPVYGNASARPRCLVYLLDKYFSKFPLKGKDMDVFYLRPISKKVDVGEPWYECSPVGKEKLRKYMETMCAEAGMSEKKTNHSLRATGATALFSAGVPEKIIRDVTGHKSNALELYERTSLAQKEAVSGILVQGKRSFAEEVDKENAGSVARVQKAGNPVQQARALASTQQQWSGTMLGSLFSGLSNCTVNISPQNFVVNVNTPSTAPHAPEVDGLLDGIELDDL